MRGVATTAHRRKKLQVCLLRSCRRRIQCLRWREGAHECANPGQDLAEHHLRSPKRVAWAGASRGGRSKGWAGRWADFGRGAGGLSRATWALGRMASGIEPSRSGIVCKRPCLEQKPKGSHAPESPQSQQPPSVCRPRRGAGGGGASGEWMAEAAGCMHGEVWQEEM